jgi:hypothetical protein
MHSDYQVSQSSAGLARLTSGDLVSSSTIASFASIIEETRFPLCDILFAHETAPGVSWGGDHIVGVYLGMFVQQTVDVRVALGRAIIIRTSAFGLVVPDGEVPWIIEGVDVSVADDACFVERHTG